MLAVHGSEKDPRCRPVSFMKQTVAVSDVAMWHMIDSKLRGFTQLHSASSLVRGISQWTKHV